MPSLNLFFVLFLITFSFSSYPTNAAILNLSPYNYPKRQGNLKDNRYQIAIVGTNDLHGYIFSQNYTNPLTGKIYTNKGLKQLSGFISILRRGWGHRFLWVDAGNQFQGGLESKISKGKGMNQFFTFAGLSAATIGNHDFDYGTDFLKEYAENSTFPFVVSNVFDTTTESSLFLANQFKIFVLNAGRVKIGVIGLTDVDTKHLVKGELNQFEFKEYKDIVVKYASVLRLKYGVNAVMLLSNPGMKCKVYPDNNEELKMHYKSNSNNVCDYEGDLYNLLSSIPEGTVDVVVSGSTTSKNTNHHFFNGIPIISSIQNGKNFNIVYLSFDKNTFELYPDETSIEGPVPICNKVFANTKQCNELKTVEEAKNAGDLSNFLFHSRPLDLDERIDEIIKPYKERLYRYESEIVTTIPEEMSIDTEKESFLGNLISDFVLNASNANISVINTGAFKATWSPGELSVLEVYEMFPFYDNFIVTFTMKGSEVKKMIKEITFGDKTEMIYQTGGLQIEYDKKAKQVKNVLLRDGSELKDDEIYTVGSNDFLMPGFGDDFDKVKQWYKPTELKYIKNFNDRLIEYLRTFGDEGIKKNMFYDANNLRFRFI